jgi:rubredoxin
MAITCSICGYSFDPEQQQPSCTQCPLHNGCAMVCCPNCGVSNINPAGSRLATLITRLLGGKNAQSSLLAQRTTD